MSSEEHRDDAIFQAAAKEIAQATSDHLRPLVIAAGERHETIAGHEHCLSGEVLRRLVAHDLIDVAQQLAHGDASEAKAILPHLLVQHITLLSRDARALFELLTETGRTLSTDAAPAADTPSEEPAHVVH
jgi:hypothetical protein